MMICKIQTICYIDVSQFMKILWKEPYNLVHVRLISKMHFSSNEITITEAVIPNLVLPYFQVIENGVVNAWKCSIFLNREISCHFNWSFFNDWTTTFMLSQLINCPWPLRIFRWVYQRNLHAILWTKQHKVK